MSNPRVRKIADRIQVIVAEMLERRIKDPRLGFVTVTDVRVTGDTQQASIFYTVLGEESVLGQAEIRNIFRSSKIGNIAGCMVTSGLIRRNAKARLLRDGKVVADNLDLASLKREKDDASEVREGFECGLVLRNYQNIELGDIVESFEMREIPRG